ncbi:MAG: diguanylate cyclase [Candidatus Cloacimonetes bacterium]|nr:diguanylate cyclase [Candidatus Cloacimonadota bacterium]
MNITFLKDSRKGTIRTHKRVPVDVAILVTIIIICFALLKVFIVSDHILKSFGFFNYKLVIELLIIFFLLTVGLIIFIYRRFLEYKEDVENWQNLDHQLHQYEDKLEKLIYNIPYIAVYSIDRDHSISSWNYQCEKVLGYLSKDVIGKKVEDLLIPNADFDQFRANVDKCYDSDVEIPYGEITYLHKNKSVLHMLSSFHKYENVFNKPKLYNFSINITDMIKAKAELSESNKKLFEVIRTDPLTQLPNKRALTEKLEYEKSKFERSKEEFSIMLIDLDNFNCINKNHNYDCGDFVLKQISNLINNLIRKQDVVSRYGGEEFVILLPQTDAIGALHVAKLIKQQIAKFPITYKDKQIALTVTIGIANYNTEELSVNDLLKNAVRAMYKGKSDGRNKIIVAKLDALK